MTSKEDLRNLLIWSYDKCNLQIMPRAEAKTILDNLLSDLEVLGQHKKIEEELGIDLITLFKVLTAEDLWWKTKTLGIVKTTFKLENIRPSLTYDIENKKWYIDLESHTLVGVELLEDYGRTWSLDKKDLTSE